MGWLKGLFFEAAETVMQLRPPRDRYVNNHPYCLHLWCPQTVAIPLTPPIMVGIAGLRPWEITRMTPAELEAPAHAGCRGSCPAVRAGGLAVNPITFTILGEVAAKANSREIVTRRGFDETGEAVSRLLARKSEQGPRVVASALRQIPVPCRVRLTGPVRVTLTIFYASERPDLDEALVLDVLQDRWVSVTVGRMKVRELVQKGVICVTIAQVEASLQKHVYHGIDRTNPRAEIVVEPLTAEG